MPCTEDSLTADWEKGQLIFRGSHSDVFKIIHKENKEQPRAAKYIRLPTQLGEESQRTAHEKILEHLETERQLCNVQHKNIVRFLDMSLLKMEPSVVVSMEMIEGETLEVFINREKPLDISIVTELANQICNALCYLHTFEPRAIIHRDINSRTIMVSDGRAIKLIDFGLAVQLVESATDHMTGNPKGDPVFMAPELFLNEENEDTPYSCASDIWAFGCVIFQMVSGNRPHSDCKNMLAIVRRVKNKGAPALPDSSSDTLKDFYAICTAKEKCNRKPAADLLKHPFLCGSSRAIAGQAESDAEAENQGEDASRFADASNIWPDKWSDQQLSGLCNSLENSTKEFGPMKQTLLMIASAKGKEDLVSKLLTQEKSISAQDVQGRTAISYAAIRGREGVLKAFWRAFEDDPNALKKEVNSPDCVGQTPLILAVRNHQNTVLEQLSKMGAILDHQDLVKFSAVAYAAREGFDDTIGTLCKLGADPKLADISNNTPLIWAARGGHKNVIEALRVHLNNSADVEHWRAKGELDMNAQEWAKMCRDYECATLIQDAIRSLASPTAPPTTPYPESSEDNNGDGDPPSGATGGGGAGGNGKGSADPSQPGSGAPGSGGGSGAEGGSGRHPNNTMQLQYPLSRTGKRLAVLINIMDFKQGCSDLKPRHGALQDMNGLYNSFYHLGFEVKPFTNVSSDFFGNMTEFDSIGKDCADSEVFLLYLMSRGEQSYIFAHDGARILLENVFKQFRQCEGLRNKPKVFIVQACRALLSERVKEKQPGELNSGLHEDCLIVYSTYKRHISAQRVNPGDRFSRALQQTIWNGFDRMSEDLPSVLTKAIRIVAEETQNQQIPVYQSTLTRQLHLPPKGVSTMS